MTRVGGWLCANSASADELIERPAGEAFDLRRP